MHQLVKTVAQKEEVKDREAALAAYWDDGRSYGTYHVDQVTGDNCEQFGIDY